MSLRFGLPAAIFLVFLALSLLSYYNNLQAVESDTLDMAVSNALSKSERLARTAQAELIRNKAQLDNDVGVESTDFRVSALAIVDENGAIKAAHRLEWLGQNIGQKVPGFDLERLKTIAQGRLRDVQVFEGTPRRLQVLTPFIEAGTKSQIRSLTNGVVYLEYDLSLDDAQNRWKAQRRWLIEAAFAMVIAALLSLVLYRRVALPLSRIEEASRLLSDNADASASVPVAGPLELRQLAVAFNTMAKKIQQLTTNLEKFVEQRTVALSEANATLSRTIGTLKATQSQLVRSEKMAGLGSMVAGVAHELNTPLGNALLMATSLSACNKTMATQYAQGMKKSDLENFLAEVDQSTDVLERNIEVAAKLIRRFKEVAVNQTSEQRCTFDLHDSLHGVLALMAPTIKLLPVGIVNDVPVGILMDSYPGAFAQVVTHMVANACSHAFEDRASGVIRISSLVEGGGRVAIVVADNGIGIADKDLPRIFDPFFTTKMGRGGTGLGLHIVLNVVEEVLGGTIDVTSTKDGAVFSVSLPLVAPASEHHLVSSEAVIHQ